jgi:transposase
MKKAECKIKNSNMMRGALLRTFFYNEDITTAMRNAQSVGRQLKAKHEYRPPTKADLEGMVKLGRAIQLLKDGPKTA